MKEQKLEIGLDCCLVETTYGEDYKPDISLDYIEHSPDHWYSDNETSIDISQAKAREIIAFLQQAFGFLADSGAPPARPDAVTEVMRLVEKCAQTESTIGGLVMMLREELENLANIDCVRTLLRGEDNVSRDVTLDTGNLADDLLYDALDELYRRGWQDRNKERDYDPRGTTQWQKVLDLFRAN